MPIKVSKGILEDFRAIKAINPEKLALVEKAKDTHDIDKGIAESWRKGCKERQAAPGRELPTLEELIVEVRHSFDLAIALLALVANEKDVERVRARARLTAPKQPLERNLDVQALWPRLREVFLFVADQENLHKRGATDKGLSRSKVVAIIGIMNEVFNRKT